MTRRDIPKPCFGRIDYDAPEKYLELNSNTGCGTDLHDIAAGLCRPTEEGTLRAVYTWICSNLTERNRVEEYGWRTADSLLQTRTYIGCADWALLFGCFLRLCKIPAVWVKTMDAGWIRRFVVTGELNGGEGHVFIEVHYQDRWRLVDPSNLWILGTYDVSSRILPDDRFAYDKGGDPLELVLSYDWERWKEQTRRYFADFDLSQLQAGGIAYTDGRRLEKEPEG